MNPPGRDYPTQRQIADKHVYMMNEKTPLDDPVDWLEAVPLSVPHQRKQLLCVCRAELNCGGTENSEIPDV